MKVKNEKKDNLVMRQETWDLLKEELVNRGTEPDRMMKEDWGTFWNFYNLRKRQVIKGQKGTKILIEGACPCFYNGAVIMETDKNGNQKPMIREQSFNKSFFHISQTQPISLSQ
jgi:hypothetical protein